MRREMRTGGKHEGNRSLGTRPRLEDNIKKDFK
jgi:hypothetical protein